MEKKFSEEKKYIFLWEIQNKDIRDYKKKIEEEKCKKILLIKKISKLERNLLEEEKYKLLSEIQKNDNLILKEKIKTMESEIKILTNIKGNSFFSNEKKMEQIQIDIDNLKNSFTKNIKEKNKNLKKEFFKKNENIEYLGKTDFCDSMIDYNLENNYLKKNIFEKKNNSQKYFGDNFLEENNKFKKVEHIKRNSLKRNLDDLEKFYSLKKSKNSLRNNFNNKSRFLNKSDVFFNKDFRKIKYLEEEKNHFF